MSSEEVGFVLVSTAARKEKEVHDALGLVEEVVDVHPLFGEYDILAKVVAESHDAIASVVVDKIRSIPGVIDTKTLIKVQDGRW